MYPELKTVLIADDEPLALNRIKRMIDEFPEYEVVGTASNGIEALEAVKTLRPDILLSDISMPGIDGLELAKQIAEEPIPPALIFCTAYDQYALEAFEVHASGYLLKPIRKEKLAAVLDKAQKSNRMQISTRQSQRRRKSDLSRRSHISVKARQGVIRIPVSSIYCFIADQKYLTVHHEQGSDLIDETLKNIEQEFGNTFVRIHRNALITPDAIDRLELQGAITYLHIKDHLPLSEPLAVSRRHLPALKKWLQKT